jgi:Modifier of rudimentary (Mod(r)) protein
MRQYLVSSYPSIPHPCDYDSLPEHNLALEDDLYKLRSDTKDAFDEAKALEARWKEVEREQREVYQVLSSISAHPRWNNLSI